MVSSNSLRTFVKTAWSIPVLPVSLLYRSSEHDGCKYSACTSPGLQQATANTPWPRGHPITDDFVRIGVTRGLACPRYRADPEREGKYRPYNRANASVFRSNLLSDRLGVKRKLILF